jgi:hypothetical protein
VQVAVHLLLLAGAATPTHLHLQQSQRNKQAASCVSNKQYLSQYSYHVRRNLLCCCIHGVM